MPNGLITAALPCLRILRPFLVDPKRHALLEPEMVGNGLLFLIAVIALALILVGIWPNKIKQLPPPKADWDQVAQEEAHRRSLHQYDNEDDGA